MITREEEKPDVLLSDEERTEEAETRRVLSEAQHELDSVASEIAEDLDCEITSGLLEEEIELSEEEESEEDLGEDSDSDAEEEVDVEELLESVEEDDAKPLEGSSTGGLVSVAGLAIVLAFLLGLTLSGQSILSLPPTLAAVSLLFVTSVAFTWHLHRTWLRSVLELQESVSRSMEGRPSGSSSEPGSQQSKNELSFSHITKVMQSRLADDLDQADEAIQREKKKSPGGVEDDAPAADRRELDAQLCVELERREEALREKILKHVEKISVFFESLLEKHVFRLNRELREKEKEIESLRESAESEKRKVAELTMLEEKVAQLEAELSSRGEQPETDAGGEESETEDQDEDQGDQPGEPADDSQEGEGPQPAEDEHGGDAEEQRAAERATNLQRLQSSQWEVNSGPVEVKEVIQAVREVYDVRIKKRRIRVTNKVPQEIGSIETDRALLEMALREILDNAVRHSRRGGRVDLLARRMEATAERPSLLRITIKDSGPGIPAKDREGLLQAPKLDESSPPPSGLGLPLAQACVQQLGGELRIQDKPGKGKGSQIVLELPIESSD